MDTPFDALGQPLAEGDHVAHARGTSGGVCLTRRIVARIKNGEVFLVPLSRFGSRPVSPFNLVKVRAP